MTATELSEYATFSNANEWTCPCGNTFELAGFEPCLPDGTIKTPSPSPDQGPFLYVCPPCGRIIDETQEFLPSSDKWDPPHMLGRTLVIGRRSPEATAAYFTKTALERIRQEIIRAQVLLNEEPTRRDAILLIARRDAFGEALAALTTGNVTVPAVNTAIRETMSAAQKAAGH